MAYRIGIDLGGTNLAAGIVDEAKHITVQVSRKTRNQASPEEMADDMKLLLEQLLQQAGIGTEEIAQAGVGIPGSVSADGVVEDANNIGFYQVPFQKILQTRVPFPIVLCNDAKAAAVGEYLAGAGKGCRVFQMVTLGTGVGGALIIDGKVLEGCNRAAGEVGHMVIQTDGLACSCGRKGCLEQYASASALVRQAKEALLTGTDSALYRAYKKAPEQFNGRRFFECLAAEDTLAEEVFERYTDYLAEGITNLINVLQPDILCIGGGISAQGERLLKPLREKVEKRVYSANAVIQTKLCAARLANDAGIIGAAYYQ